MKRRLFSTLLAGTAALLIASATAMADGMPYGNVKPQPALTPLDQALDQLQAPPETVEETVTTTEETTVTPAVAPALAPPVPDNRVVEVQENTSFFGLSVGMYDAFTHGQQAPAINLEWQPGVKIAGFLQPIFGGFATTEGSMMGYGGLGVPFNITDNVFLMPSVAVGAYKEGAGYDLDRTLAFRYGTELAYQFDDKSRLGINAHIISNGKSFDREDRTEVVSLVYTMPTSFLSGRSEPMAQPMAPMPLSTTSSSTTTTTTTTQPAAGTLQMPPPQDVINP